MKRLLTKTLLSVILLAAAAAAARAQSTLPRTGPPPGPAATSTTGVGTPFDPGRLEGDTYVNDFFGVSFTLPKGWTVLGAADNKRIVDKGREIVTEGTTEKKKEGLDVSLARTNFLVSATKFPQGGTGQGFNAMLMCVAERVPTAFIKTGPDYFEAMRRAFEGTAVKLETTGPLRTEAVGGVAFTVADMKMTAGSVVTVQRHYVRIMKGYALAMTYVYFDESDLKSLDGVLRTVKFK